MILDINIDEDRIIHELFTVVVLYLINKNIDFYCSSSKSSKSKYIQIKNPKVKIRISNHWQEECREIQVITIFDLSKIFSVL